MAAFPAAMINIPYNTISVNSDSEVFMKEILIKNVTILTMDDENSRFFGWVLLKNGKIDALGEGEPPACSEVLDGWSA